MKTGEDRFLQKGMSPVNRLLHYYPKVSGIRVIHSLIIYGTEPIEQYGNKPTSYHKKRH
jgi:hypothetical protein